MDRTKEILKRLIECFKEPKSLEFDGLHWGHPLNIIISGYYRSLKFSRHKEDEILFEKPFKATLLYKINFRIQRFKTKVYTKYQYYQFSRAIKNNIKLIENSTMNFLLENYDTQYQGSLFNPYGDNVNITNSNVANICMPLGGLKCKSANKYFNPILIHNYLNIFNQFVQNKDTFSPEILKQLKAILVTKAYEAVCISLERVNRNYQFFFWLLTNWKPAEIYIYDSYNEYSLGLIAAAKKLKIKIIEQQHGIIYPSHFGYQYQQVNIIDKSFICDELHYYTEPLIERVKKSWEICPELKYINHSPSFQLWEKFGKGISNKLLEKLLVNIGDRKLVSLGLTTYEIPAWLIDCLIDLDRIGDFYFCIRPHPRHINKLAKHLQKLQQQLVNLDIEISSEIPLFDLLNVSSYFLSDGSSTLIDALEFNLPAACFDAQFADSVFKPYIELGEINLINNKVEFIEFIKKNNKK